MENISHELELFLYRALDKNLIYCVGFFEVNDIVSQMFFTIRKGDF